MNTLKANTVLHLTQDDASDLDREAAKLLARCDVERRAIPLGRSASPAVDVLVHADKGTLDQIMARDHATRIEHALREVEGNVRMLQWVEEGRTKGPVNQHAAGDGRDVHPVGGAKNPGDPPKFDHNGPGPVGPLTQRGGSTGQIPGTPHSGSSGVSPTAYRTPLSVAFPRTLYGEGPTAWH